MLFSTEWMKLYQLYSTTDSFIGARLSALTKLATESTTGSSDRHCLQPAHLFGSHCGKHKGIRVSQNGISMMLLCAIMQKNMTNGLRDANYLVGSKQSHHINNIFLAKAEFKKSFKQLLTDNDLHLMTRVPY